MRIRTAVAVCVPIALLAVSCGTESGTEREGPATAARPPGAVPVVWQPTDPERSAPTAVALGEIPSHGVVLGRGGGVAFVGLDGAVIARLDGFHLYFQWTVPGNVILRSRHVYYLLDADRNELRPLASKAAAFELVPQFQDRVDTGGGRSLDLETPRRADVGFWAYALLSPDGSTLLSQWSGECEVPKAFFLGADGGHPVAAFGGGESYSDAPESRGLGWTSDGRAVVQLMAGLCGPGGRPGVYLIRPGGPARLLARLPEYGAARMWGPA